MKRKILILYFIIHTMNAMSDMNNLSTRNPFVKSVPALALTQGGRGINLYSINDLKLVGVLQAGANHVAILSDPYEHLYLIKIKDQIGLEKLEVSKIDFTAISLQGKNEVVMINLENQNVSNI
jgi:Tfp pilus assembly protein PilP